MNKIIFLLILMILIASNGFCAVPTGFRSADYQNYDSKGYKNYYVDPSNGSNSNEGSLKRPYSTLEHALNNVGSGKCIINLHSGNYGSIKKLGLGHFPDWVVIRPFGNGVVLFERMEITGTSKIIFDGIQFSIPKYGDYGFLTRRSSNLQFRNLKFFGENKYLGGTAISITGGENYLIYKCDVKKVRRGFLLLGGIKKTSIISNKIDNIASTAINYGQYNEDIVIARNNISSAYSVPEEYVMEGYTNSHGSGISLRDGNVLIKENIFRNLGASSGIMTYTDSTSAPVYSNIYIQNNLFYDILNPYIMRFYNAGENIEIINNTLSGSLQSSKTDGAMKLGQTIYFHKLATGYTGENITIANNISIGWACAPKKAIIKNNIFWSFSFMDAPFKFIEEINTNKILTSGKSHPINYFKKNFFADDMNFEFMHGKIKDYNLSEKSPAKKLGDLSLQTENSLGKITKHNFIGEPLRIRDDNYHSLGCYENLVAPYGLKIKVIDKN